MALTRRSTPAPSRQETIANEAKKVFREVKPIKDPFFLIPTGSTLLNLALSDKKEGGYVPGSVINIVGDSSAGKTFLLWTMFAEVVRHAEFKDYRLIYDEPESAFYMQAEKLFGIPHSRIEMDIKSETIQDWFKNVVTTIRSKTPFIYGIDSLDALSSIEEKKRIDTLLAKGEQEGSYKTEKARIIGELLRNIVEALEKTKSLVPIISQTRDNIGVTFGEKKTRSGGRALRFYSTHEFWLSVEGHIARQKREVGVNVIVKVKKNKLTGKLRQVTFPIYFDYGVDDIGSCIDFLLEEKVWTLQGNKIVIAGADKDLFKDTRRDLLIKHIEENNLEDKLRELTEQTWHGVEDSIKTGRKPRYSVNDD